MSTSTYLNYPKILRAAAECKISAEAIIAIAAIEVGGVFLRPLARSNDDETVTVSELVARLLMCAERQDYYHEEPLDPSSVDMERLPWGIKKLPNSTYEVNLWSCTHLFPKWRSAAAGVIDLMRDYMARGSVSDFASNVYAVRSFMEKEIHVYDAALRRAGFPAQSLSEDKACGIQNEVERTLMRWCRLNCLDYHRLRALAFRYLRRKSQCYYICWRGPFPSIASPIIIETDRVNISHTIVGLRGSEVIFAPYATFYPDWPNDWDRLGLWADLPVSQNTGEYRALVYIDEQGGVPVDLLSTAELAARFHPGSVAQVSKGSPLHTKLSYVAKDIQYEIRLELSIQAHDRLNDEFVMTWFDLMPGIRQPYSINVELHQIARLLAATKQHSLAVVIVVPFQRAMGPVMLQLQAINYQRRVQVQLDQCVKLV